MSDELKNKIKTARKECEDAKSSAQGRYDGLSDEQKAYVNDDCEFRFTEEMTKVNISLPDEDDISQDALTKLESAKTKYGEHLEELDSCLSDM